jgi:hypothetical protein
MRSIFYAKSTDVVERTELLNRYVFSEIPFTVNSSGFFLSLSRDSWANMSRFEQGGDIRTRVIPQTNRERYHRGSQLGR